MAGPPSFISSSSFFPFFPISFILFLNISFPLLLEPHHSSLPLFNSPFPFSSHPFPQHIFSFMAGPLHSSFPLLSSHFPFPFFSFNLFLNTSFSFTVSILLTFHFSLLPFPSPGLSFLSWTSSQIDAKSPLV